MAFHPVQVFGDVEAAEAVKMCVCCEFWSISELFRSAISGQVHAAFAYWRPLAQAL